jgi:hypothetical protein
MEKASHPAPDPKLVHQRFLSWETHICFRQPWYRYDRFHLHELVQAQLVFAHELLHVRCYEAEDVLFHRQQLWVPGQRLSCCGTGL